MILSPALIELLIFEIFLWLLGIAVAVSMALGLYLAVAPAPKTHTRHRRRRRRIVGAVLIAAGALIVAAFFVWLNT